MAKTATAPAPVRGGSVGAKIAAAIFVGIIVYVVGLAQGWWGGGFPGEEEQTEQERVDAYFEVVWGAIRDTGELYEDTDKPRRVFECVDRPLNITYYIDGEPHTASQHESDVAPGHCRWKHHVVVPVGTELRVFVEEVGGGGWKACGVWVRNQIALPDGFRIAPGGDDCRAWGIAS